MKRRKGYVLRIPTKRVVSISLTSGIILVLLAMTTALAWTYLGNFAGSQYWSPNAGEKWAQFVDDNYRNRYLDIEAYNFWYSGSRIVSMAQVYQTSMVFHAFRQNTNCFVNLTYTGYYWTNYPYPYYYPEAKTANCSGENYSGNNEIRIWVTYPGSTLSAGFNYYAGAEYKDRSFEAGGPRLRGEMNYDAYSCLLCKEWLQKFYFNEYNQLYN